MTSNTPRADGNCGRCRILDRHCTVSNAHIIISPSPALVVAVEKTTPIPCKTSPAHFIAAALHITLYLKDVTVQDRGLQQIPISNASLQHNAEKGPELATRHRRGRGLVPLVVSLAKFLTRPLQQKDLSPRISLLTQIACHLPAAQHRQGSILQGRQEFTHHSI